MGISLGGKKSTSSQESTLDLTDLIKSIQESIASTSGNTSGTRTESGGNLTRTNTQESTGRTDVQQVGDITTTGGGTRTQTVISQEGINAVMNEMLGRFKGISEIATGEKVAGLYGSTAQTALQSELLARTAGEIGKLTGVTTTEELAKIVSQAPTVTTTGASAITDIVKEITTPKIISEASSSEQLQKAKTATTTEEEKKAKETGSGRSGGIGFGLTLGG